MSENNCLFCRIIAGEIPATKVFEDDQSFAFRDINPQAPMHILLIPKKHIASLNDAVPEDVLVLGHLMFVAPQIAKQQGFSESGFRVVANNGTEAGQTVWHLHLHVLGGRPMTWPPG